MYAAASKLIATRTHVHGQEDACTYRINPRHAPAAGFGGDGAQAQERQGRVRAVLVVHSKASCQASHPSHRASRPSRKRAARTTSTYSDIMTRRLLHFTLIELSHVPYFILIIL